MHLTKDPTDPAYPHGTVYGYQSGCHCRGPGSCTEVQRHAALAWQRRMVHASWGFELKPRPADRFPAWYCTDRVQALYDRPFSYKQIARLTGVRVDTIMDVRLGRSKYVQRVTRDRIMAVPADIARPPGDEWLPGAIPREWVEQMVGSLAYLGWPGIVLAERVYGGPDRGKGIVLRTYQTHVTRDLYVRVKAVYDDLGNTRGPSRSASIRAANKGWGPPGAYEAHRLIPGAIRTNDEVESRAERREQVEVRKAAVVRYRSSGATTAAVAATLRITEQQVRTDWDTYQQQQRRSEGKGETLGTEPGHDDAIATFGGRHRGEVA